MNKYNIYKRLDLIPIWNYIMCQTENDLRYLYILDDYNELPEINEQDREKLNNAFKKLIGVKKDLSLKLISLETRTWYEFRCYLVDSCENSQNKTKSEEKYNRVFSEYRNLLNETLSEVVYNEETFVNLEKLMHEETFQKVLGLKHISFMNVNSLYSELKKILSYNELLNYRMYLLMFLNGDYKQEYNFFQEVQNVEMITGRSIDVFTYPAQAYFDLKEKAIEINRKQQSKEWQK